VPHGTASGFVCGYSGQATADPCFFVIPSASLSFPRRRESRNTLHLQIPAFPGMTSGQKFLAG
jgi:hypothetical protein